MIKMTVKYKCRSCQSESIVKNGRNVCGNQQYRRKDCGACKVLEPSVPYSEERKEEILRAYQERSGLRGISRTFGVSRPTVTAWLIPKGHKKKCRRLPAVAGGIVPARADDMLELDELCGYVGKRANKVWTWTAL